MLIFNILDLFHNFQLQRYNIQKAMSSNPVFFFTDVPFFIHASDIA